MVTAKRKTKVFWDETHREMVAKEMAEFVLQHKHNFHFPFKPVFTAAQVRLGYVDRGLFRDATTTEDAKNIRDRVNALIADKYRPHFVKPTEVAQAVAEVIEPVLTPETALVEALKVDVAIADPVIPEVVATQVEADPVAILTSFMQSATALGQLLITERQARQVLELKLTAQQQLLNAQQHELSGLRRSIAELEDFLTKPKTEVIVQATPEPERPILHLENDSKPVKRKPRVFVVGMETRNHAQLKNLFDKDLDLRMWVGDSRPGSHMKFRDDDSVIIMTDFVGHVASNSFFDTMKKAGLKRNCIRVVGGMTAATNQLRELIP